MKYDEGFELAFWRYPSTLFENDIGQAITDNGECYRSVIFSPSWPKLNVNDVMRLTVNATLNILHLSSPSLCCGDPKNGGLSKT